MAVSQTTDGFMLPCGRQLDALWQTIEAGHVAAFGEHERTCPHCRTARASLTTLWQATRALAAERVSVPPGLTERIMAAVRAEVRRARMVPLPTEPPGEVEISDQAVAMVLRFAADSIDGIRAHRCTVWSHEDRPQRERSDQFERDRRQENRREEWAQQARARANGADTVQPPTDGSAEDKPSVHAGSRRDLGWIDVRLSLAVRYGAGPADDLLAAVRRAVTAAADARIGLRIARCDLMIEDVYL